ncbi:peptidoglycan-binding domain-containing protein [uncultured Roseibium sp.]|uniref:peptidoglycan-binding domain-containing protein n=1 Tax=uncultured Roseibium sp. TaxID=1936171 RepID=UPI003217E164
MTRRSKMKSTLASCFAAVIAGSIACSATALAGDESDIMSRAGQCYGASYARKDGTVKDIRLSFRRSVADDNNSNSFVDFHFSQWDVPNDTYGFTANCTATGGEIVCGIECDGGRLRIQMAEDGRLFAEAVGLRNDLTNGPDSLLPPVMDADGLTLSSIFALTPIGKPGEACEVSPQQTFVALQAGDLSPRVKILETKLNSLGHFLEFPNMVFDETTTKAVKSFQAQYNIPMTGVVDRRTAETIESAALISAGGC